MSAFEDAVRRELIDARIELKRQIQHGTCMICGAQPQGDYREAKKNGTCCEWPKLGPPRPMLGLQSILGTEGALWAT